MSINPSATNYAPFQGSYNNNQTAMFAAPGEGSRAIPASITWTQYPMNIVSGIRFNCAPQGPNIGLSQIGTLYVDNTQCAHNLTAYFPDSGHQIEINAFSAGFFPVISNSTNFILAVSESQPPGITSFVVGEVTLLQILNVFAPPSLLNESPINVAIQGQPTVSIEPVAETSAVLLNFSVTANNTFTVLNTGQQQTLEGFDISLNSLSGGASGYGLEISVIAGVSTIWLGDLNPVAANTVIPSPGYIQLINKTGINIPILGGVLKVAVNINSGSLTFGTGCINAYYH